MHFKDCDRGSLYQPDALLPGQYLSTFRSRSPIEPEKKLMLAVLEDALFCFYTYLLAQDRRGQSLFYESENWIFADDRHGPFCFEHICEVSGIAPNYLRKGLLRWKEKELARHRRSKSRKTPARHSQLAPDGCAQPHR